MELQKIIASYIPSCEQEAADRELMLAYLERFSDLLTRENKMAHFTASGWVRSPDKTRYLMAYHRQYDSWAWLGGHADGEDDLLSVAMREVGEESGLSEFRAVTKTPISLEILDVAAHEKRGKFISAHVHLNLTFLFEAGPAQTVRCKPDENAAVRWFTAEELEKAVSEPKMLPVYRKLQRASTSL